MLFKPSVLAFMAMQFLGALAQVNYSYQIPSSRRMILVH